MDGPAGSIGDVWIFSESFQLTFHLRRNRHLTASAEKLGRPNPITVVVIRELFNVGYSTGLNIPVILSSVVTRVARIVPRYL